jgi:hypothetical protein
MAKRTIHILMAIAQCVPAVAFINAILLTVILPGLYREQQLARQQSPRRSSVEAPTRRRPLDSFIPTAGMAELS